MDPPPPHQIYGGVITILLISSSITFKSSALHQKTLVVPNHHSTTTPQINSNSILVALLDSHYTELSELIEKALLLQTLERAVSEHNITILAPSNEALQREIDPEFKRFLLEPRNLKSLQSLILFHIIPSRIESERWPVGKSRRDHGTLLSERDEKIQLHVDGNYTKTVDVVTKVTRPDDVVRPDGVIHGIDKLLVPKSVQHEFNRRRSLRDITAVLPEGAPEVDPRTHRLKKPGPSVPVGSPPLLPIYDAMSPGPSIAPAPAPGPGGPHHHFDGHKQINDFIQTLLLYGGYNEMADILVNLTSLASEMGRLVSEGYVLTVLAPNDEAMAKLSADRLSESGAPEQIMYYHLIPEYQTEESMYNAVRRFGKVRYDTLRLPHKVVAEEADGSVRFGRGDGSAYLFDPDIYTDGRISVQGIDGVLFPVEEENVSESGGGKSNKVVKSANKDVSKARRGKLLETACRLLGVVGQDTHFSSCH